jgi:hypothetical protein
MISIDIEKVFDEIQYPFITKFFNAQKTRNRGIVINMLKDLCKKLTVNIILIVKVS